MHRLSRLLPAFAFASTLALACAAQAQSSCSSDRVAPPTALLERFINADCESCWSDKATPAAGKGALAVDWVVPGLRGEDAPLAVVAGRDGLQRLEAMRRDKVLQADAVQVKRAPPALKVRVAHGLAFNGYIGGSIALQPARGGPWTAWLLLVETLPAGTEKSPVERNLVRNALRVEWPAGDHARLQESRPMQIPEGASPKRLRVVGWVEDEKGQVRGLAQSRCGKG